MKNDLRIALITFTTLVVVIVSTTTIVIFSIGALSGYAPRTTFNMVTSFTCPNSDALSSAAIRSLPLELFDSQRQLTPEYAQKLASLEAWAETIDDRCTRIAYLNWVDNLRRDVEKQKRVQDIASTFPKPPG